MHHKNYRKLFKSLSLPLIILGMLLLLSFLGKYLSLPTPEDLVNKVIKEFGELKVWAVFLIALIEGFLFLGQYFPGGMIIFFSIISAGRDIPRISILVTTISIAFIVAYSLNYAVGKYGLYGLLNKLGLKKAIKKSQKRIEKKASTAIAISYEDPNIASITATAAGIAHIPFRKFLLLSIIWAFIWNIFWATLIYFIGEAALNLIGVNYIFFILGAWIAIILFHFFISKPAKHNL